MMLEFYLLRPTSCLSQHSDNFLIYYFVPQLFIIGSRSEDWGSVWELSSNDEIHLNRMNRKMKYKSSVYCRLQSTCTALQHSVSFAWESAIRTKDENNVQICLWAYCLANNVLLKSRWIQERKVTELANEPSSPWFKPKFEIIPLKYLLHTYWTKIYFKNI